MPSYYVMESKASFQFCNLFLQTKARFKLKTEIYYIVAGLFVLPRRDSQEIKFEYSSKSVDDVIFMKNLLDSDSIKIASSLVIFPPSQGGGSKFNPAVVERGI